MNAFLRSLMPLNHVLPSFVRRVSAETVDDLMCRPKSNNVYVGMLTRRGFTVEDALRMLKYLHRNPAVSADLTGVSPRFMRSFVRTTCLSRRVRRIVPHHYCRSIRSTTSTKFRE